MNECRLKEKTEIKKETLMIDLSTPDSYSVVKDGNQT